MGPRLPLSLSPQETEVWEEESDKMVSRRAILSRSRDDLNLDENPENFVANSDDQWFSKEKLYKDHIVEVLSKWDNIDDEIWAKVIVLERNRRIAKAYARAPVLTINGSTDGFDGFRIGVNGFENPLRDPKVADFKSQIGAGCKVKMDDSGNILVKRLAKSNIYVKNTLEENSVSNDILKLPNGLLEQEKPFKLFDMKKFQQNVNRELKRQYPERHKLETQCISTLSLVRNEQEVLDSPIWVMLINVVALEMLKAKMPEFSAVAKLYPGPNAGKLPPAGGSSDEDPYSLSPSGSSGSSGKGLQGRARDPSTQRPVEKDYYGPQTWAVKSGHQPALADEYLEEEMVSHMKKKIQGRSRTKQSKKAEQIRQEDPYYHGLAARVSGFPGTKQEKERMNMNELSRLKSPSRGGSNQLPGPGSTSAWWQDRMYPGHTPHPDYPQGQEGKKGGSRAPQRNRLASPNRPTIFQGGWK